MVEIEAREKFGTQEIDAVVTKTCMKLNTGCVFSITPCARLAQQPYHY